MSEGLLFKAKWAGLQIYHDEHKQVTSVEMTMRSALYYVMTLSYEANMAIIANYYFWLVDF
jgi:hypothetical protein